jgi:hypothetical protein
MRKTIVAAAISLGIFGPASASAANIYKAGLEFDSSPHGSTGVWSYGKLIGAAFTPLTYYATSYFGLMNFYGGTDQFDTPLVGDPDGVGQLLMHPGEFGEQIDLRFTAPSAGAYTGDLTAFLEDASCGACGGTDGVLAIVNGATLILDRPGGYSAQSLSWTGYLSAGGTIDFKLDPRGNYDYDSTRALVIVTSAVPEPATWAVLLAGLGLVGATLRRVRRREPLATWN